MESKEEKATGRESHAVVARGICRSRSGSQGGGTETGDVQVGGLPREVCEDYETERGNTPVGK